MKKIIIFVALIAMSMATQAQRAIIMQAAPTSYELKVNHQSTPEITLSGSDKGVTYQLYRSDTKTGKQIPVGKPVEGTGKSIVLVPQENSFNMSELNCWTPILFASLSLLILMGIVYVIRFKIGFSYKINWYWKE